MPPAAETGATATPLRPPLELATVGFVEAAGRQASLLWLRLRGTLPRHFQDHAPPADGAGGSTVSGRGDSTD